MENNNNNFPNYRENMYHNDYGDEGELYSINRNNNQMYDRQNDRRYDQMNDRRNDRRYDQWDNNMYYNYPDYDRNNRSRNPMWWMFWPFFFF